MQNWQLYHNYFSKKQFHYFLKCHAILWINDIAWVKIEEYYGLLDVMFREQDLLNFGNTYTLNNLIIFTSAQQYFCTIEIFYWTTGLLIIWTIWSVISVHEFVQWNVLFACREQTQTHVKRTEEIFVAAKTYVFNKKLRKFITKY